MNKVILIGRLTADPELRQTQSGTSTCSFSVAVDRNNGADKEKTADFIRCVAFGKKAEFVGRYFNKGKQIAIIGNLKTGSYKDRNHEDVTHYTTDVWVDEVEFVGSKGDSGQTAPAQQTQARQTPKQENMAYSQNNQFEEILSDGDVPF